jgi:hypothetical protein
MPMMITGNDLAIDMLSSEYLRAAITSLNVIRYDFEDVSSETGGAAANNEVKIICWNVVETLGSLVLRPTVTKLAKLLTCFKIQIWNELLRIG